MTLLGITLDAAQKRLCGQNVQMEYLDNLWADESQGDWRVIRHRQQDGVCVLTVTLFKRLVQEDVRP